MTFTKDDQDEARTLHAKLNQRLQAWRASQNYETKLAYRLKKDQVRSFWLRHGEDVLAALEEAWERGHRLLELVADLVAQGCETRGEGDKSILHHSFISAYEDAFGVLEAAGLLKDIGMEEYQWQNCARAKGG